MIATRLLIDQKALLSYFFGDCFESFISFTVDITDIEDVKIFRQISLPITLPILSPWSTINHAVKKLQGASGRLSLWWQTRYHKATNLREAFSTKMKMELRSAHGRGSQKCETTNVWDVSRRLWAKRVKKLRRSNLGFLIWLYF